MSDVQHFTLQMIIQIMMSVICGIIGAECRNALDILRIGQHPKFHLLESEDKKKIIKDNPFRYQHYLIGSVAAFVELSHLHRI